MLSTAIPVVYAGWFLAMPAKKQESSHAKWTPRHCALQAGEGSAPREKERISKTISLPYLPWHWNLLCTWKERGDWFLPFQVECLPKNLPASAWLASIKRAWPELFLVFGHFSCPFSSSPLQKLVHPWILCCLENGLSNRKNSVLCLAWQTLTGMISLISLPLNKFSQNWPINSKLIKVRRRGGKFFVSIGKHAEGGNVTEENGNYYLQS